MEGSTWFMTHEENWNRNFELLKAYKGGEPCSALVGEISA